MIARVPESFNPQLAQISTHAMLCDKSGYLQVLKMEGVEDSVIQQI